MAVPVAAPDAVAGFADADEVVCLSTPPEFRAVGHHYVDFSATSDEEVVALLDTAASTVHDSREGHVDLVAGLDEDVQIPVATAVLEGHLHLPAAARGVVVFAHGSGSSRHSPRNAFVADVLQQAGLGTLLLDLLTHEEEADRARVFDIEGLAARLSQVTGWLSRRLSQRPGGETCRIGSFGASTGAAAALWAAAEVGSPVSAVVSRGGRPDLAAPRLADVGVPTLLIVGGEDDQVLELNRWAERQMRCPVTLAVIPGATHLFEEPGTLDEAASLARDWFLRHLVTEVALPHVQERA
jgi:putative phosphoribosyl transferase